MEAEGLLAVAPVPKVSLLRRAPLVGRLAEGVNDIAAEATGAARARAAGRLFEKGALPDPVEDVRYQPFMKSGRENIEHRLAAEAEAELAQTVHAMPNQAVIRWGDKIGTHGADTISVDISTGDVHLWDAKYRSNRTKIGESTTFSGRDARNNAIAQAQDAIGGSNLPADIQRRALQNLERGLVDTHTVPFGNAHGGVSRRYP